MAKNTGKVREFCQSGKVGTLQAYQLKKLLLNIDNKILTPALDVVEKVTMLSTIFRRKL